MLDSHHHLWNYSVEEYPWIPAGSPLAQDQLIPELTAATSAAEVEGTVVVQARQVIEESDWLGCLLRIDSYKVWADTVRDLLAPLTSNEQTAIATTNCRSAYAFQ